MNAKTRILILVLILVLINSSTTRAQKVGGLFLGTDIFAGGSSFKLSSQESFDIDAAGYAFGFLIPVRFPRIDSYYKVGLSLHGARSMPSDEERHYIAASNELLLGKRLRLLGSSLQLVPQVGIGMVLENIYSDWGVGYVYDLVYLDIATTISYFADNLGFGVMMGFVDGVYSSFGDYEAKKRIGISLLLWL